ncbi:hypothetical protein BC826DRAFT_1189336, partial [Russula brevipes]
MRPRPERRKNEHAAGTRTNTQWALGSNTATPYTHRSPAPANWPARRRPTEGERATWRGHHPWCLSRWLAPLRSVAFVQASWPCTWPRPCTVATPQPPRPQSAHPQDNGLRPCPGWPTALRSSAFVQATTVRSAAPQAFTVGVGIVPQAAGAQVRRLRASSLLGPRQRPSVFTKRRFAIPSCHHPRSSRHHSCHAASTALPTVNGGEHCAASATRMAASTALPVQHEWRGAPSTALPVQHERQRAPHYQCNANGGEHRAASTARTAASTALAVQRERRRAPRCQRNANGGEHCAASATRTAASTALPAQRERRRAPRSQRNANGGEHRAASATRMAASAVLPAQRKRQQGLRWPRNGRVVRHGPRLRQAVTWELGRLGDLGCLGYLGCLWGFGMLGGFGSW